MRGVQLTRVHMAGIKVHMTGKCPYDRGPYDRGPIRQAKVYMTGVHMTGKGSYDRDPCDM